MHQDEFLNLNRECFMDLISSGELEVEKEEDVFEAIMLWLNHDPDARSKNFHKILEKVQLPLIRPHFLRERVATVPVIAASPECQRLLVEAEATILMSVRHQKATLAREQYRLPNIVQLIIKMGGHDAEAVLRGVQSFDPLYDKWWSLHLLPYVLSNCGVHVAGRNSVFLAGGKFQNGLSSRLLLKYNPVMDRWDDLAPMNMPRSDFGFAALHGYLYAIGGYDGILRLSSVERYNLSTNVWEYVAPMKISLKSPTAVSHGGYLYVAGGVSEEGEGINLVQRFDPKASVWTKMAPMLVPRLNPKICVFDNLIYVFGGWRTCAERSGDVECYDPEKNEWKFRKSMIKKHSRLSIVVVEGIIYAYKPLEGWINYHETLQSYDPKKDEWTIAECSARPYQMLTSSFTSFSFLDDFGICVLKPLRKWM